MTTIASYAITRYRPRLRLSVRGIQEIVGYGSGYTVAEWTWQIRDLIKAFVVGRFLGPQAVGYVSVAVLIVRSLEFGRA